MRLQSKLVEDLKSAMKARDSVKVGTLRLLRAHLKDAEIAKGDALSSEDELAVLATAAKKSKEAIEFYENSGRDDLLDKEKAELVIIASYLPRQLTEAEIAKVVSDIVAETKATSPADFGKVMGIAMQRLKGQADGKLVQRSVRNKLS
jgi:uncharacterized protein YqeY